MYGATREAYLGLPVEQAAAIVQVTDGLGPGGALCTGAFVSDEWVVSAAHCLAIADLRITWTAESGESEVMPVTESVAHPERDVALFRVARTPSTVARFVPIAQALPGSVELSVGSVVEISGYGFTEEGDTRERRFLAEPIVEEDDESVVVNGFGVNGACLGDSGGPLLVRDRSGPVRVAGVLSSGSASCLERDRYIRLDALDDWITRVTGSSSSAETACGGIDEEGRCWSGSAFHCEAGALVAEPCTGNSACGWDRDRAGFRCVAAGSDPCQGVDSVGACRDGVAARCDGGVLETESCGCGDVCGIDGRTGSPRCSAPVD